MTWRKRRSGPGSRGARRARENAAGERAAQLALRLWGGDPRAAERITAAEQSVYRFSSGGRRFYLRLTPVGVRTRVAVEAEVDFVRYLGEHGLAVASPAPSRRGAYVEAIGGGTASVHATAFEEASGDTFRYDASADNREHFRLRGRILGRLHALSREYALSRQAGAPQLPRWNDDRRLREASRYVPPSDEVFWSELRDLTAWLETLPTGAARFGPIHGDFGATNYRVAGDTLTLFDFGDACHHWYAYDVAVSVYPYGERPERGTLLATTLEGYAEHSPLDARLEDAIAGFCRLRLIYMYLVYAERWGLSSAVADRAQWFARKRERMRHPVEWRT